MASKSFTATATGAIAGPLDAGAGNTYGTFNIKVNSSAPNAIVSIETSPDNTTWTEVCRTVRTGWAFASSNARARYVRANVINLGTGGTPVAAVINANP